MKHYSKKNILLIFLVLCNGPEEVRIALAIITGYGALSTIANNYGTEVFRNTSNGFHRVRTSRTCKDNLYTFTNRVFVHQAFQQLIEILTCL